MKPYGKTEPFRGPDGGILPDSVAEVGYLRLGGIDQWVMIRGENAANPALVLVHGGPGFPETGLFRIFNRPLEKGFTVVYWEQRGTNRSFHGAIPESSMTIDRFVADLDELVDAVRDRLGQKRVALYGHSWGSLLGVLYADRFPEKVSVYVGTGQIGDLPASEALSYAFTLAEAERRGNRKAVEQLRGIGPPPYPTTAEMMVQRKWLTRFVGIVRGMSLWKFFWTVVRAPEESFLNLPNIVRGVRLSTRAMWPEIARMDLTKVVPVLRMPVFFFIGRHDRVIAPETSKAYFNRLSAPSKKFVWFEESAHEAPVEEPEKFHAAMADLVRPMAIRRLAD